MLKKIAVVGGVVAVAGLGLGGAAWAESNSTAPTATAGVSVMQAAPAALTSSVAPAGTAGTKAKASKGKHQHAKREALAKRLEKVSHAQWVTKDGKTGAFVTHDAVRGIVSAVSGNSITIKAADNTTETFTVNSVTKVHVRGEKKATAGATKPAPATISQVKVGDAAGVLGTGADVKTATRVLDRGIPKPAKTTATTPTTTAPTTS